MKREGDDFLFLWRSLRVGVALTGVREDDGGRVQAEITVTTIRQDGQRTGLLEWGSLNLSSLSARESLERVLRRRTEAEPVIDWDKALRWVCSSTAEEHRQGSPVVDLATVGVGSPQKFLFDRVFPLGEVGTLYGDGSSGKSLTAMLLAVSYALGEHVAGVFRPTERGTSLYLDWETTEEEQADRLDCLSRGLGLARPPSVLFRGMQRTLPDDSARVRQWIDKHGVGLVVIDSMGLACGNVLDPERVARFYGALRSFPPRVTKLVLTHLSAEGAKQDSGAASPIGLRWVNNYGRSNWEIRGDRNDASGFIEVALYHRKVNAVGFGLQPPIGLRYTFDPVDGAIGVDRFDVLTNVALTAHTGVGDRIVAFLRETPAQAPEIAAELGLKQNVVRMQLSRLSKAGMVGRLNGTGSPWCVGGAAG